MSKHQKIRVRVVVRALASHQRGLGSNLRLSVICGLSCWFSALLREVFGLSAGTEKHCIFGHLRLVFIWSCFVFCLLFLSFYVISDPVPAEATGFSRGTPVFFSSQEATFDLICVNLLLSVYSVPIQLVLQR